MEATSNSESPRPKPIDAGKLEIYKYVQGQHATLIAARQGIKTRLGHFLVLTGFLITVAFIFATPNLLASIERAASQAGQHRVTATILALLPLPVLVVVLCYLTRSIWAIIAGLAHARLNTIGTEEDRITSAFAHEHLDGDHVIHSLTKNYIRAIKDNEEDNYEVATRLYKVVRLVRRAVVWTVGFVVLTLAVRMTVYYVFPAPLGSVRDSIMSAANDQSGNSESVQTPVSAPSEATPNRPAAAPAEPAKPNLDMVPNKITASPRDKPEIRVETE